MAEEVEPRQGRDCQAQSRRRGVTTGEISIQNSTKVPVMLFGEEWTARMMLLKDSASKWEKQSHWSTAERAQLHFRHFQKDNEKL